MIRPETDDIIAFLNQLVAIDPYALAELLTVRVPCNADLAAHATVQVAGAGADSTFIAPGTHRVGMLGILNGFCGVFDDGPRKDWGPIAAVYESGKLARFERTKNEANK